MPHVKTSISLEQPLYEQLERRAREMRVSRSSLLAQALADYLERWSNRELLMRINEAYAEGSDDEDRTVLRYAGRQHRRIAKAES